MVMLKQVLAERQPADVRDLSGGEAAQIPEMFVRMMSPLLPAPNELADRWAARWARSLTPWEALARLVRVMDALRRSARTEDEETWLRLHAGWCCCLAEAFRRHLAERGAELPEVALGGPAATHEDTAVAGALLELRNRSAPPAAAAEAGGLDEPIARVLRRLYDWSLRPRDARC
jgi:hypothetical protein